MPYQSQHASEIARLMAERGRVAGDRALQRGQMWGGAIKSLSSLLPQIQADKAAQAEAEMRQRQQASALETDALQRRNIEAQMAGRQRDEGREDEARQMAVKAQKVNEWLSDIASNPEPELQKAAYEAGRPALIQAGVLTEQDAPAFFPGQSWVKSRMSMLLPATERFKQLFPDPVVPKTREIKTRNADGTESIQIVEDTPGQSFVSQAEKTPIEYEDSDALVNGQRQKVLFDKRSGNYYLPGSTQVPLPANAVRSIPPQGPAPSYAWHMLKDGTPAFLTPDEVRRVGAQPLQQNRVPTESERKAGSFYPQMEQAITNIEALEPKLTEQDLYQLSLPQEGLFGALNRSKLSDVGKRYLQALEQFTEARLRPVSGATITPKEYEQDRRTYARQFSETPELATQRAQSRRIAFGSLGTMAGRANRSNTTTTVPEYDYDPATGQLVPRR